MNIWKSIYLNCGERYEFMIDHRSFIHTLSSCEIQVWKNSGLNGIQTNDLCNTGAVHYQMNYQANWELVTLSVHNNTVHVKESNEYLKDHIIFKLWRKIWRHDHCSYKQSLKCHYDQIIDIHFFTFLYTVNLFSRSRQISIYYEQ